MKLNKVVSTLEMPHEEWLRYRKKGIGGSDAGAICGVNKYRSAVSVFLDKTAEQTSEFDNEAMRQGRDLEQYVAERFCEETGKKVRRANAIFSHSELPFMLANVDRLVVGENVKQYGKVSTQVIRFGENLLDFQKYVKAEDIKTAIIPIGAPIGANNVTIKTAEGHDGTDYIYSPEAVELYGWICDKVDFPDINNPNTLLKKAQEYLNKCINLTTTIELTAVDLHKIDVEIDAIGLGDLIPCVSTHHNLLSTPGDKSTYYLVNKYEIDLENPSNTKITLGKTLSTLSEKTFSNEVTFEKSVLIINNNVEKVRETANGANDKSDMAISIAQSKDIEAITNLELDEICK